MRRTIQIAGQLEYLFGTLDENLKLLESSLHVSTYLQDNSLSVEGEAPQVDRAIHILGQFNDLVREGRQMDNWLRGRRCCAWPPKTPAPI